MRIFDGIDELRAALGQDLGRSGWLTVDQERIDRFAEATGDLQWIHVDPSRATDGPFGSTIAHGYLTLSLIPVFLRDIYRLRGMAMTINYGLGKVRLPAPVRAGSRLRASCRLAGIADTPAGHRVTFDVTIEIEEGPKPACVAEALLLVVPARS